MPNLLKDLIITEVALCPEGVCSEAHIQLYKSKTPKGEQSMNFEEVIKAMKPEYANIILAEIDKAKAEIPAATQEELAKARKKMQEEDEDDMDEETMMKSLDPKIAEMVKKAKAQAGIAQAALLQMQEAQATTEAIAKAKEVKHVPVEEAKLAELYKALGDKAEEVFGIFKAMSNITADGGEELFKAQGAAGEPANNTDAWTQIEAKATEIAKSENIPQSQAISKALKQNPDLYKEYVKSLRGE